ncbi:hypothetical protein BDV30DRAFT_224459 [Aspergillus minisclerotigenes]|uniref:Secreted protein n=1 Tax=Aspergillus minisclerotigenes TaxID=656917 RepID=A0A5N6JB75_9EURO|nr:hypothetical protein BDV30DRAFT_224459 [Aspergillus minisclerotigenes]
MKTTVFSAFVLTFLFACPGGAVPIGSEDNSGDAGDVGAIAGDETSHWVKRAPPDHPWRFAGDRHQGDGNLPSGTSGDDHHQLRIHEERSEDSGTNQPLEVQFVEERPQGQGQFIPAPINNNRNQWRFSHARFGGGNGTHRLQYIEGSPQGGDDDNQLQFAESEHQGNENLPQGTSGHDLHELEFHEETPQIPRVRPQRPPQGHRVRPGRIPKDHEWKQGCGMGACIVDVRYPWNIPNAECH